MPTSASSAPSLHDGATAPGGVIGAPGVHVQPLMHPCGAVSADGNYVPTTAAKSLRDLQNGQLPLCTRYRQVKDGAAHRHGIFCFDVLPADDHPNIARSSGMAGTRACFLRW